LPELFRDEASPPQFNANSTHHWTAARFVVMLLLFLHHTHRLILRQELAVDELAIKLCKRFPQQLAPVHSFICHHQSYFVSLIAPATGAAHPLLLQVDAERALLIILTFPLCPLRCSWQALVAAGADVARSASKLVASKAAFTHCF
jgi:hypothetical protein